MREGQSGPDHHFERQSPNSSAMHANDVNFSRVFFANHPACPTAVLPEAADRVTADRSTATQGRFFRFGGGQQSRAGDIPHTYSIEEGGPCGALFFKAQD
jgi:hypothetical protein